MFLRLACALVLGLLVLLSAPPVQAQPAPAQSYPAPAPVQTQPEPSILTRPLVCLGIPTLALIGATILMVVIGLRSGPGYATVPLDGPRSSGRDDSGGAWGAGPGGNWSDTSVSGGDWGGGGDGGGGGGDGGGGGGDGGGGGGDGGGGGWGS